MERPKVPAVISAHHAGSSFAYRGLEHRVALTPEQRVRFSDYGTDVTAPKNGTATIRSLHSRGIGNLNTDPWNFGEMFAERDFAKPEPNLVWIPGLELEEEEKQILRREIYEPYHLLILNKVRALTQNGVVVAWDNTADYAIGKNQAGEEVHMPDIVLSNRGAENTAKGDGSEIPSCDPQLLEVFGFELQRELAKRGLSVDIFYNLVYRGGYIARQYSTARHGALLDTDFDVQAFQVEYNTKLTHNQETLEPYSDKMTAIREAAEIALWKSL